MSIRKHFMPEFPPAPLPSRITDPSLSPWQREALTRLHFASGRGMVIGSGGPLHLKKRYTVAEAADVLGVSVATVRRALDYRQIGCYRPGAGRRVYFLENHLDDYIRAHEVPPCDESKTSPAASGFTSSQSATTRRTGVARGSTPTPDSGDSRALLRKILRKPKDG
jgi:excisionase family DNA binding protein